MFLKLRWHHTAYMQLSYVFNIIFSLFSQVNPVDLVHSFHFIFSFQVILARSFEKTAVPCALRFCHEFSLHFEAFWLFPLLSLFVFLNVNVATFCFSV